MLLVVHIYMTAVCDRCLMTNVTGDTKGKNCKSPYEGEEDLEVKEQACEAYETDPTDRSKGELGSRESVSGICCFFLNSHPLVRLDSRG